eukprot:CAMPEP_0172507946 /NCGR_PEP_ID=MMETSP1066-20121228/208018_1 /TAXON_ID=671091 /ORGANISM="Coscinodiscus wailesii, Strain CCMP2513" /LENGTH=103 /DNA_ID=CAMNT_0013285709 /DNA_START=83 /DNA_END=391 /DNA_ORIENTATION=+
MISSTLLALCLYLTMVNTSQGYVNPPQSTFGSRKSMKHLQSTKRDGENAAIAIPESNRRQLLSSLPIAVSVLSSLTSFSGTAIAGSFTPGGTLVDRELGPLVG